MEEILASIRRIISEDGKQPEVSPPSAPPPKAKPVQAARSEPKADVLELTEVVEDDGSVVSLNRNGAETEDMAEPEPDAEPAAESEAEPEEHDPAPVSARAEPRPAAQPLRESDSLLSAATAAAAAGAFASLNSAAQRTNAGPVLGASGRTVEDLVIEALRPMLAEWLDQNLPKLTERLVKREIARLARRAEEE